MGEIHVDVDDPDAVDVVRLLHAHLALAHAVTPEEHVHALDGMGLKLLQAAGLVTAFVTKEKTAIVERRGQKLAIPEVHQGVEDKVSVLNQLAGKYGITLDQIAYIGDDVNDLEALKVVGFSAAPADALPPVLNIVKYVCQKKGGEGAVREVTDLILATRAARTVRV